MNPLIKEAFLKQRMKREIRKLRKTRQLKENLYATFVEPFTDVLQAVNLGAQDFLNSYVTYLRLYITWNPEKGKQLLSDHDKRRAEIAAKWKPLMDKTDTALATGDADIIALAYAPQVWALSAVGAAANEYAGNASEILSSAGLGALSPFSSDMSNYTPPDDDDSSILDKLQTLFFGAALAGGAAQGALRARARANQNESLLREASEKDLEKDLEKHFDATGVSDDLEQVGEDLFQLLKDDVEKFEKELRRAELFMQLKDVEDFESFSDIIDTAEVESEDGNKLNSQDVKSELSKAVEKMLSSQDFKSQAIQVLEKEGKKSPTEDDIKKFAEKTSFLDVKKSIEEELGGFQNAAQNLRAQLADQVKQLLPSPDAISMLKRGKATEVVSFIENTKNNFNIS